MQLRLFQPHERPQQPRISASTLRTTRSAQVVANGMCFTALFEVTSLYIIHSCCSVSSTMSSHSSLQTFSRWCFWIGLCTSGSKWPNPSVPGCWESSAASEYHFPFPETDPVRTSRQSSVLRSGASLRTSLALKDVSVATFFRTALQNCSAATATGTDRFSANSKELRHLQLSGSGTSFMTNPVVSWYSPQLDVGVSYFAHSHFPISSRVSGKTSVVCALYFPHVSHSQLFGFGMSLR